MLTDMYWTFDSMILFYLNTKNEHFLIITFYLAVKHAPDPSFNVDLALPGLGREWLFFLGFFFYTTLITLYCTDMSDHLQLSES